jgi:hypothetical protein
VFLPHHNIYLIIGFSFDICRYCCSNWVKRSPPSCCRSAVLQGVLIGLFLCWQLIHFYMRGFIGVYSRGDFSRPNSA